jgi:outer membrane biosynthesis protein TonB
MTKVGDAWRAASGRQKVTIAIALFFAVGSVATLATPPGSPTPGPQGTALASLSIGPSLGSTSSTTAETPTEPVPSAAASSTPTVTASAQATPKPTPKPTPTPKATPKPTPKPVVLTVRITSVTSPAYRNSYATLTARTHAAARCSIEVDYASGSSTAAGLVDKTASSSGAVSWTWKVGGRTTKGTWPIYVNCTWKGQSADAQTTFRVA